ncbi:MAG: hypothetical protein ABI866_04445, partial [Dokdonella sp.]
QRLAFAPDAGKVFRRMTQSKTDEPDGLMIRIFSIPCSNAAEPLVSVDFLTDRSTFQIYFE